MTIFSYISNYQKHLQEMMLALNLEDEQELPLTEEKLNSFFKQITTDDEIEVFLAKEGEEIIGYATLSFSFSTEFGGAYAELEEIYIQPEHRGEGFGKQLIAYLENYAKQQGAKSMFLVASNDNQKAKALYENLGYQALPRIEYLKNL